LVLSAHATTDARAKAFAAGCAEFETKPVDWESLFKKIEAALAQAATRAAAPAADEIDLGSSPPAPEAGTGTGVLRGPADKDLCAVERKHILVVEDNDANRAMLCRRLNKHGYETTEAADGRRALELVRQQRFDLVLCDIMMPEVDGFAVLEAMKA